MKPFCAAGDSGKARPKPRRQLRGDGAAKKRSDRRQASSLFTDRLFGWYLERKREGLTALFRGGRVCGMETKNPNIEVKTNIGLNLISISTLSGEAPVQTGSKLQVIRQKFEEVSVFLHELKRIAFDVFCLVSVVVVMCRLLIYEFR